MARGSAVRVVATMAAAAVEKFGGIDVLINNAALYGSLTFAPFDQLDESEWDATMNVNVKGIWQCCKAVFPSMKERGAGSIVNISSLAATYGMPNGLHYTASKAAVIGATRGLARELGRFNIRVNAISPGFIGTDMTSILPQETRDGLNIPLGRLGSPDEIAAVALFLLSDASSYITGQVLHVNGGLTTRE